REPAHSLQSQSADFKRLARGNVSLITAPRRAAASSLKVRISVRALQQGGGDTSTVIPRMAHPFDAQLVVSEAKDIGRRRRAGSQPWLEMVVLIKPADPR